MAGRILFIMGLLCAYWISANCLPLSTTLTHLLSIADLQALKSTCQSKPGGCSSQDDKAKRNRAAVKASLTVDLGEGHEKGMSAADAEQLLQGTQTVKSLLLAVNQLTGIVPHDNGLIGGDRVIKNQAEIDILVGRLKNTLPGLGVDLDNPTNVVPLVGNIFGRRKRSDGLSLDYYRGNRWPSNSINVFIDSKIFSSSEAQSIRNALKSITSQVPCLTFVESNKCVTPCIEYVKAPKGTDEGTCGWSSVGYQKDKRNDVNLNFDSSVCRPAIKGVAVHETLHALGFAHEHTRNDRDTYMKINWNNVDPQSVDVFDKDDPNDYNPYGQQYDELSIMHYDVFVGAADSKKPSMTPIKSPQLSSKIGNGDSMTSRDAALLKRLYCTSTNCRDAGTNCGWRALNGECSKIGTACPKSCGTCDSTSFSG